MANKQSVYTYPDRKLYGEYDLIELLELRIKYIKGEIPNQLCYIISTDEALIWDEYAVPDRHCDELLDDKHRLLLIELLSAQIAKKFPEEK